MLQPTDAVSNRKSKYQGGGEPGGKKQDCCLSNHHRTHLTGTTYFPAAAGCQSLSVSQSMVQRQGKAASAG